MQNLKTAEQFAREKHNGMTRKDGITPYFDHLQGVVNRLKNLRVSDEEVLEAAWLHDTLEDTNTTFDEIDQRFGSKVAVLVLALSKDKKSPKNLREKQYVEQLKDASFDAKLIKLCDISSNLKDLKNAPWTKTKKTKEIKKKMYYLNIIKPDLIQNKSRFPGIQGILGGINDVIISYGLRPIML
jgi:(p)ppGpp synthase/HD superfamily hydrolase